MKTILLFFLFCLSANAQTEPQYHYNFKPIPFELDCSKRAKNAELPVLTWSFRYHFKIKNADTVHLNIAVTPPFRLKNLVQDEFEIVFDMPFEKQLKPESNTPMYNDSLFRQYFKDTTALIRIKNGKQTAEFRFKVQPVPNLVLFLTCKNFQTEILDTCASTAVYGMWERPLCASFYKSRFAGHFSTALYDTNGNRLQHYDGWYDGGDRTRDYELSAKKYGLQKGDIVELRIDKSINSTFRAYPQAFHALLHTKLRISPTQLLTQRFRLQ
jgi:hypothetical protein